MFSTLWKYISIISGLAAVFFMSRYNSMKKTLKLKNKEIDELQYDIEAANIWRRNEIMKDKLMEEIEQEAKQIEREENERVNAALKREGDRKEIL